ncbi:hypothetical protein LZC94_40005 [Pendulispora albinea]|uniref:Uncharacterized protein n=1 Tax=Pendulispora albinea TaxID=2741071 RepID=A0ABZ2LSV6_9BACT
MRDVSDEIRSCLSLSAGSPDTSNDSPHIRHRMRAERPRILSSRIEYFCRQLWHRMIMIAPAHTQCKKRVRVPDVMNPRKER